jgi:outer membrane receptor protein involved in Fe transport
MYKIQLLTFLLCFISVTTYAQRGEGGRPGGGGRPPARILSGIIVDENQEPIPYASVSTRSVRDTTRLRGIASNVDGTFEMSLRPGRFKLTISFLSYENYTQEISLKGGDLNIGTIQLKPNSALIDEVVVKGEKGYMEMKLDRRIYNVGKDPNNAGSNAQEILETVPSVEVDVDGTVSLRGSSNVRILVDGKPSGLTGISTQDALRQLQGSLIEKIEVVTNASARYDAEGEAGIINIVLKKEKRSGFNGSVEVNAGYPHKYGASANLNYRTGKVNVFGGIGGRYRESPGTGNSRQEFFLDDTTFSYEKVQNRIRGGYSLNGRFGVDYFINKKTNITASGMYSSSWNKNTSSIKYSDYNENGIVTQVVNRAEEENETGDNIEANLNFRRTFKSDEQLLTADVRWFTRGDFELADLLEVGDDYTLSQRTENIESNRNWLIQTDYVHPFSKNVKLETGLKATLRRINNDYQVEQFNDSMQWEILERFDNNFVFDENVYAAYLMASGKIKRFSIQGGVRAEYSDITTELTKTNEKNRQQYISFFPSAHLSYEFASNNSIQLSYSRRISRPRYRHLLPFFSLTDNRNIYSGNPNVKPIFTHSAELGYLKNWDKGSLLTSIYYRHRDGVIERISRSDSTGLITTFPVNLSTEDAGGLELSFSYSMFKWWRVMLSANAYYSITNGTYETQSFYAEALTARGRFTSKWTIWKKLDVQTAFMYRAPRNTAQGKTLSMYSWDIGLTMDVFKGNGTVTFNVKDILNSRKRRWEVDTPTLVSTNDFQWRARQFTLSFTYRINQKKKRGKGSRRDGGGGDSDDGNF